MRKVKCHECGKHYDYDVDDFCPRCGAFTLPARASRIGADGSVIWNDGIRAQGHKNSFVHSEYHEENRKRGSTWLEGGEKRQRVKLPQTPAVMKGITAQRKGGLGNTIGKVIFFIVALNILSAILGMIGAIF